MTNDFNLARDYLCTLNYTVTWTDYIPPLYHPTGYLPYNLVENTLRLTLPGHIPDSREFLAHLAWRSDFGHMVRVQLGVARLNHSPGFSCTLSAG